jgi:PAS domain S-box-containing protein
MAHRSVAAADPALNLAVFRRMADLSSDAFYLVDENGQFLYVNDRALALTGYSRREMLRLSVADINPEFPQDRYLEFVAGMPVGSFLPPFETLTRTKDGLIFPIEISVARMQRHDTEYLFGVVRDIRERKQLQLARKTFARRMLQTLESERERVAHELAEDVGNAVAQVGAVLAHLEEPPDALPPEAQPTLAAIRTTLQQITASVGTVVHDYQPTDLLGTGLIDALRLHTSQFAERHGLDLRLTAVAIDGLLSSEHELHVFRIVQEAVANVARHARARRVVIALTHDDCHLTVTVRDDGVGFVPDAAGAGGFGLVTMRERATLMGATLTVDSTAGGTTVRLLAPIVAQPSAAAARS